MTEIVKVVEKVNFIVIKGPKGSLEARHLTKNVPGMPGSLTHFKPARVHVQNLGGGGGKPCPLEVA